jgi:hypothetical protein
VQQTGRVNPRLGATAGSIAGGQAFMKAPLTGAARGGAPVNGQIAGSSANGYRTIHSLAWNNANTVATSRQMGYGAGQMTKSPLKGTVPIRSVGTYQNAGAYQPVRSTSWNPSGGNYSVPVRSISPQQPVHSVAYQPVRSTPNYQPGNTVAYQPVRSTPAWNGGNRVFNSPVAGNGAHYQQAPSLGWKGANQGVRAPAQNGSFRSFASAPSTGSFRPSGGSFRPSGGGSFMGGSSGFSGRSFGGGSMGSFGGGGGFHR